MMSVQGQLLEMLKAVAVALGDDLRERLVFVGGCTTALFKRVSWKQNLRLATRSRTIVAC